MSQLNEHSHVLSKLGKNHTESVANEIYIQTLDYRVVARLIAVSRDLSCLSISHVYRVYWARSTFTRYNAIGNKLEETGVSF